MKRHVSIRMLALSGAFLLVCCSGPLDKGKPALRPELFNIVSQYDAPSGKQNVFLIGENHASVRGQKQLAELLGGLYDRHAIEAILIEGSNGAIDTSGVTDSAGDAEQLRQHWKDELEWGRIAAYEYIALTRPDVVVFGIEDLAAQSRFASSSAAKDLITSTKWQLEGSERANNLFDRAEGQLGAGASPLRPEIAKYKQLVAQEQVSQARLASSSRAQELMAKLTDAQSRMAKLVGALQPFQGLIAQLQVAIKEKNELRAESLNQSLESLMRTKNYDETRLIREETDLSNLYRNSDQWSRELTKLTKPFQDAHDDSVDQFCIVANALREQGELQNLSFPEVESFFADENVRIKKLSDAIIDKADLAERDRAMNDSVQEYFRTSGKTSVAMIVGYAHLESAEEGLRAAGISFIAGTLPSINDDLEPWEGPAWEKRHEPIERIFAATNKDRTRFQDPNWKSEESAKLSYFRNLLDSGTFPKGSARYFEGVGGNADRVARVGDIFVDRNAETGEHILEQGVVPGGGGGYYQVYDRSIGIADAKTLSDAKTVFSYSYKRNSGQLGSVYQFSTPTGTVDFKEFMASPPKRGEKPPQRVVLFGEPDDVLESGATISPSWKTMRTGGGGGGEPPRRGWTTAFADPADEGGNNAPKTELMLTINAQRAKEKLAILDRQDPLHFERIQFVEADGLENLWFTPRRGDRTQVVVFIGRNDPKFRDSVRRAALEGKLRNKQIALITCGDAFAETASLRELLLREGALMVWVPDRQITPEAGNHLEKEIADSFSAKNSKRPRTIQGVIERSLNNWRARAPNDPDLKSFEQNATWVLLDEQNATDDC